MLNTIKHRQSSDNREQQGDDAAVKVCDSFIDYSTQSFFLGCVTIDPAQVNKAWDLLSDDLFAEQVADYPKIIHTALIDTLNRKARSERQ